MSVSESRTDLDSHADQCVVGRNALLVHDYDRPINVSGYDPTGPITSNLRTVSAALAYDDAATGQTVILVINQAIYIPTIHHNLLATMQVRLNDVKINDTPRFLTENPDELTHSIVIPMEESTDPYVIPLGLKGVSSSFPTRLPTREEYETLPHLVLTSDDPEYDPHDPAFAEHEDALTKYVSETGDRIGAPPPTHRICVVSNKSLALAQQLNAEQDGVRLSLRSISATFDIESLPVELRAIQALQVGAPGKQFDAEHLSKKMGIDIHTARRTVTATTQRGIRTLLHPTLSRRFRTNNRQLHYRRLPIDCFTDTLISNTASARGDKYAQIRHTKASL